MSLKGFGTDLGSILIVDDEAQLLHLIKYLLEDKLGYTVEIANSGAEALAMTASKKFALVVTDFKMPGMDGAKLARKIRVEQGQDVPIVLLTGYVQEKSEIFDAGINAILPKPIILKHLRKCFMRLLDSESQFKQIPKSAQNDPEMQTIAIGPDIDSSLLELGAGGAFISQSLLENFDDLQKNTFVNLDLNTKDLHIRGIGHIEWIHYTESVSSRSGLGIQFAYLDDNCRDEFLARAKALRGIPFIPMGKKQQDG